MSPHYTGPWEVLPQSDSSHCCFEWTIWSKDQRNVCEGFSDDANACLIAAAPEMLQELKLIHQFARPNCDAGCTLCALIAKAEGQS